MLAFLKGLEARQLALYFVGLAFFALPISTSASDIFYILAIATVLFSGHWVQKWNAIKNNPISYWLFGFALLLLVGALYSAGQAHYIKHDLYKHLWIFFTPLLFGLFSQASDRQRVLNFFLVSMALVMFLSYLKYFHLIPGQAHLLKLLHLNTISGRATVFQSHIAQAFFLSFAAGCWFYYFAEGKKNKMGYLFLTIAAGVNISLLNSGRTGFITYVLFMVFLIFHLFSFKKAFTFSFAFLGLIVLAFVFNHAMHHRVEVIRKNVRVQGSSVGLRVAMFENGWKIFKKKPWFGYGTGGFSSAYASLPQQDIDKTRPSSRASGMLHYTLENSFLNIMIEYGVVGLFFLLSFIAALWYYARVLAKPYDAFLQGFLLIFFVGAMATAFLSSSFSKHMFSIMLALGYGGLVLEPKASLFSRLKFSLTPD